MALDQTLYRALVQDGLPPKAARRLAGVLGSLGQTAASTGDEALNSGALPTPAGVGDAGKVVTVSSDGSGYELDAAAGGGASAKAQIGEVYFVSSVAVSSGGGSIPFDASGIADGVDYTGDAADADPVGFAVDGSGGLTFPGGGQRWLLSISLQLTWPSNAHDGADVAWAIGTNGASAASGVSGTTKIQTQDAFITAEATEFYPASWFPGRTVSVYLSVTGPTDTVTVSGKLVAFSLDGPPNP